MWEVMFECHKRQFDIISAIGSINANYEISLQSESRRHIAVQLENELGTLSSSFMKWIEAQKAYVQAINGWLFKCVSLPQISSKRKRRIQAPPLRNYGPPIYVTCGVWLDKLEALPSKGVVECIRALAVEISHILPRQDKNQGKSANHTHSTAWHGGNHTDSVFNRARDEDSENWVTGFDSFRSRLTDFLGQLNSFSAASVKMFSELQDSIEEAKRRNAQVRSNS